MGNLTIQIPKPCHEHWDQMHPTAEGRFCLNCQKTVVDYTTLSDRELIRLLSQSSVETCGRFRNEQLNRPLIQSNPNTIPVWRHWLGLLTLGLFGWPSAKAQVNPTLGSSQPTVVQAASQRPDYSVTTLPVPSTISKSINWTVSGRVMLSDSIGHLSPVSNAHVSVSHMGNIWQTQTDSAGSYTLSIATQLNTPTLNVWVYKHNGLHAKATVASTWATASITLDDIIVIQPQRGLRQDITGGGIAIIQTPSRWQRLKRKLFH